MSRHTSSDRRDRSSTSSSRTTLSLVASAFVLANPAAWTASAARPFSYYLDTPTQCGQLSVSWSDGKGPYQLLLVPTSESSQGQIINVTIPASASSPYSLSLAEPAGLEFIAAMWDNGGKGLEGTSVTDVLTVGSSSNTSCLREPNTIFPDFYFSTSPESNPSQCSSLQVTWDTNYTAPAHLVGMIPGGNIWEIDTITSGGGTQWTVDVSAGTQMLLAMSDTPAQGGFGTGGSTSLWTIQGGSDSSCLASGHPASVTASSSASSATSSVKGVGGGGGGVGDGSAGGSTSSKSNIGAIAGGAAGGVVALLALAALIFFLLRRRRRQQNRVGDRNGGRGGNYSPVHADKTFAAFGAGGGNDQEKHSHHRGHHRRNTFASGVDLLAGAAAGGRRSSEGRVSSSPDLEDGRAVVAHEPTSPNAYEPSPYFVGGGIGDHGSASNPRGVVKSMQDPSVAGTNRPSTESSSGIFSGPAASGPRPASFGSTSEADTWADFANRWGASGGAGFASGTSGAGRVPPPLSASSLDSSPVLPIASRFSGNQLASSLSYTTPTSSTPGSPGVLAGATIPAPAPAALAAPPLTAQQGRGSAEAAASSSPARSVSTRKAPLRVTNPSTTGLTSTDSLNPDEAAAGAAGRGPTRFVLHEDAGEIQAVGPDPAEDEGDGERVVEMPPRYDQLRTSGR